MNRVFRDRHRSVPILRWIGLLEAVSFLLLVFIAVPLKHLAGWPHAVRYVGMIHGVLFLAYVAALLWTWASARWPVGRVVLAFAAALVPGGPFFLDRRMKRWAAE